MDILINILLSMLIVLGIVLILWLIYWLIWSGFFIPMNKSLRYHERKNKLNQEFNKIEVKIERMEDELDVLRADYRDVLVLKDKAEDDILKKQELLKKYNDELKDFRKWKGNKNVDPIPTTTVTPEASTSSEPKTEDLKEEKKVKKPVKKKVNNI
jgi:adenylate kinase family enzyme